ncbi:MAG: aminotransferase class I/II-fold pyridoxal phosphate-dependent enzyme [Saccharothrix sp.]|nr:aminotransferase class I/II-fold pyridoxal phosphate-dependent enzyme [Saccharothrix sp.]
MERLTTIDKQPAGAVTTPPAAVRHSRLMDDIGQAVSIKYNNLVYELKAAGHDIVTLSLGEAFFDLPPLDFSGFDGADLNHYSHSRGLPRLRARLADYYGRQLHVHVDPDRELLVTAGSKAALYQVFLATLDPGDEVVIPEPFWLSYPEQVRLCGGVPVPVPCTAGVADLAAHVTDRTRAIVINNPNNPSGRLYTRSELELLHDLADRHDLLLLVDEAYNEFVLPDEEFVSCGALDPGLRHTVVVNSMSKNYGISGWRIGYVIAHRALVDQLLKINQHLVTCAPTPLSVYLAEHVDELMAVTRPQIERSVRARDRARRHLAALGVDTMPGSATFYLFASLGGSALTSEAFTDRLLRESGVSVVPGIAYGASCDHHVRISVGAEPEDRVTRGLDAVARLIERTSR